MKTILKIDIEDNGLSFAECKIETELDIKRLVASLLVLMTEDEKFKTAIMAAATNMLCQPETVKQMSEKAKDSAKTKISGNQNSNIKN